MRARRWTWFLQLAQWLAYLVLVTSLWGCAGPYEIMPSASGLPSSAQVEADRVRYAIPKDLRARLDAAVAESLKVPQNLGANRQFVAQMPDPRLQMQQMLLQTVLDWAAEKPPEDRLTLQTRQMQAVPRYEVIKPDATEEQPSTLNNQKVEFSAGAAAGAVIAGVPLGPFAADVAIELRVLPKGTYYGRVGRVCGEFVSGVVQMWIGCTGISGGVGISGTGGGSVMGIPLVMGSYAILATGTSSALHAVKEAGQLWREGPPPEEPAPQSEVKLLNKPKPAKPTQPATEAAPAKPTQPATPVETQTTTFDRTTGVTTSTKPSGTTTVTRPRQAPGQSAATVKPAVAQQPTSVYVSVNGATGQVQYAGITNDLARRTAEHLRQSGFRIDALVKGLSRSDARAVEQALIEIHGLGKNGGTLLNQINSVAKTNPTYAQQLQRGYDLLKTLGYK